MTETTGRHDRRNFILNLLEGSLYVAGASLISAQTVLPALVTRLGGGNVAVGALSVIVWTGLFLPQVFASRYGQALQWKKPWVINLGLIQRLVLLLIVAIIFLFGSTYLTFTLISFLALFTVNQVLMGLTTPVWFDFFAKLTPIERRGRLAGLRNSIAGTFAFLGSFYLTWLLGAVAFPTNYSLVIASAVLLQFASLILQSRLIEDSPSRVLPQQSSREYFGHLHDVLAANHHFRMFLVASLFLVMATIPFGFFTVYAMKEFNARGGTIGSFTLAMVVGQIIGGLINGHLADRYGNRLALLSATGCGLLASVLALTAPTLWIFHAVFLFVGMNLGSELMLRYNLAVEYGPIEHRATYVGLMNTILAPVYLVGLLGGWLSDLLGYPAVFAFGLLCSTVGILIMVKKVHEPRMMNKPQRHEDMKRVEV